MPTYSPCQVTLALVDRVSYIDKGGEWLVSRSLTLFSRRGAIAFSISAPLSSRALILKVIMPLHENRVWLRETSEWSGVADPWNGSRAPLARAIYS